MSQKQNEMMQVIALELLNTKSADKILTTLRSAFDLSAPELIQARMWIAQAKLEQNKSKKDKGDVREWIVEYLEEKNYVYSSSNETFSCGGSIVDATLFDENLILDGRIAGFDSDSICRALEIFKRNHFIENKNKIIEAIKYRGENELVWQKLRKALNLSILDERMLKHWIKNVKLKLSGRGGETEWHTFLVLFGPQGKGKTVFLNKFLSPVSALSNINGKFTMYSDSRELFNLVQNYVIMFDEMSKAEKADVESIKNYITSNVVTYRKLGLNKQFVGPNNHSAIGGSNVHISRVIRDATGARRFWQIAFRNVNQELINSIDYSDLWRSVDENVDY